MPSLPSARILIIATPTAPWTDFGAMIDDDHTVDVVRTEDELTEFPLVAYDLVFVDDRHPNVDSGTIAHRLATDAKLTLITDSEPANAGIDPDYDDHLVRPVTAWDFERTIDSLRARQAYIKRIDDHFEVARRMAEVAAATDDPHSNPEYRILNTRAEQLQAELTTLFETFSSLDDPAKIFYDLQPAGPPDPPTRPAAIVN